MNLSAHSSEFRHAQGSLGGSRGARAPPRAAGPAQSGRAPPRAAGPRAPSAARQAPSARTRSDTLSAPLAAAGAPGRPGPAPPWPVSAPAVASAPIPKARSDTLRGQGYAATGSPGQPSRLRDRARPQGCAAAGGARPGHGRGTAGARPGRPGHGWGGRGTQAPGPPGQGCSDRDSQVAHVGKSGDFEVKTGSGGNFINLISAEKSIFQELDIISPIYARVSARM